MYDLVIIGGGPAALSAANYALGKQLQTAMVAEQLGDKAGARQQLVGQLGDEFLAGDDAVRALERRVAESGILMTGRVTRIRRDTDTFALQTESHGTLNAAAVLVATGATPIDLPVPGASEFLGHGLGYSIATHAHLMAGKTVAVVGNTLRAVRGATELAETAARLYLIVNDRTVLINPLAEALQRRDNVEVLLGARVTEVAGSFSVEELLVEQNGSQRRLAVDAAFVDLGLHANSGPVRELLDLAPGQFIAVDERNATAIPGLFAAGDVTTAFGEQMLIAIGEGAKAALAAYDYLLARRAAPPRQPNSAVRKERSANERE